MSSPYQLIVLSWLTMLIFVKYPRLTTTLPSPSCRTLSSSLLAIHSSFNTTISDSAYTTSPPNSQIQKCSSRAPSLPSSLLCLGAVLWTILSPQHQRHFLSLPVRFLVIFESPFLWMTKTSVCGEACGKSPGKSHSKTRPCIYCWAKLSNEQHSAPTPLGCSDIQPDDDDIQILCVTKSVQGACLKILFFTIFCDALYQCCELSACEQS